MTRIILCEGETDLVLISYYLERTKGWVYTDNPKGLKLNLNLKFGILSHSLLQENFEICKS